MQGTWTLFDWLVLSTYMQNIYIMLFLGDIWTIWNQKKSTQPILSSVTSKATTSPTHVVPNFGKSQLMADLSHAPQSNQPNKSCVYHSNKNHKRQMLPLGSRTCLSFLNLTTWKPNFQPPTTVKIWEKICFLKIQLPKWVVVNGCKWFMGNPSVLHALVLHLRGTKKNQGESWNPLPDA